MDRLKDLEVVLNAEKTALEASNWAAFERLSERVRAIVMETAMADERDMLEQLRRRLLAFRSAMTVKLNPEIAVEAAIIMLLRSDAGLAAVATQLRPRAHAAEIEPDVRSGTERVLDFLKGVRQATTTEICEAANLAQGTVSRMLTDLKMRGLVNSRRAGKHVYSRLTRRGMIAAGQRAPARVPGASNRLLEIEFEVFANAWNDPSANYEDLHAESVGAGEWFEGTESLGYSEISTDDLYIQTVERERIAA